MQTERLYIQDIETGARHRAVDMARVGTIKASIAEIGLRTPITVSAFNNDGQWSFRLVAGAHRLEALRQLGEEFVEAYVMEGSEEDAELWEIDENFARAELSDAQRASAHVRRKAILDGRLETKAKPGPIVADSATTPYARKAAADLGVSPRTVRQDLLRGNNIERAVLDAVQGTDMDKGVVLDELARTPRDQQPARLEELRASRSRVSPAADPLNDGEATERQYAALMAAWNRAGPEARTRFLEMVDGPVFDRRRA